MLDRFVSVHAKRVAIESWIYSGAQVLSTPLTGLHERAHHLLATSVPLSVGVPLRSRCQRQRPRPARLLPARAEVEPTLHTTAPEGSAAAAAAAAAARCASPDIRWESAIDARARGAFSAKQV